MAPGSASKTARAPGTNAVTPANSSAKSTAQASFNSSTQHAAPNGAAIAHTQAQLLPAPTSASSESGELYQPGLPQPDSTSALQIPPYKDGRIRNPVPSKLKGKTSTASGRFSVMHMDIRGKDMAADRDLAAKRTSENTAMAAKMAYANGYQPHRKTNWMPVEEEKSPGPSVPFTGTTPYDHTLYGLKQPSANPPKEKQSVISAPRPLSPQETKEEQARLLTLLRSLQPMNVVDQLCKALAFFGGVPDAPPPRDGKFPESAEANGSGSVFVGWIAEIFPNLDAQGKRIPRPFRAPEPLVAPAPEKRGRGRPKGSKASKVRSDKGIKKGSKKGLLAGVVETHGAENDESWVDVDDTGIEQGNDVVVTGAVSAPPQHAPEGQAPETVDLTGSAKKRGRPKGSKNRPKEMTATGEVNSSPAPISALFSIGRKVGGGAGGRPKGSKSKSKDKNNTPPTNPVVTQNGSAPPAVSEPLAPEPQPEASMEPQSRADPDFALSALKAFNESHANDVASQAGSFQPANAPQAAVSTAPQATVVAQGTTKKAAKAQTTKKRKRKTNDSETSVQPLAVGNLPVMPQPPNGAVQPPAPMIPVQPTVDSATPAPKRQRKSTKAKAKAAANDAAVVDEPVAGGTSQVSQTPVVPPASATQPADTQYYTSPTIEELEAQLEQHDEQDFSHPEPSVSSARQSQPPQVEAQPPLIQPVQPQQTSSSKQAQQRSEQQRAIARQRQQYQQQQQQQQQQQSGARTASPSLNQAKTASPHMSVQSASPNVNPIPSASPNLHQQRAANSQTPTSISSQVPGQQTRNNQNYYTQQTVSSQSPYSQHQVQQNYANPQPAKQHFNVAQSQQQQQTYAAAPPHPQQSSQQQQSYTSQQSQYSHQKQQSYSSQNQQQYASPQQQQYTAQQRVSQQPQQQQQYTTSGGTSSQNVTAQSPQYGTSTGSGYNSNDGSFRANSSATMNFNPSGYGSSQTSNTSRNSNPYSSSTTSSYGNPTQQISSYSSTARRNVPATTTQTTQHQNTVQGVQSMPQNLSNFSDFASLNFDNNLMSGLDSATGNHNSLSMTANSYNMGSGNVPRTSAGAGNFNFDSTMRNDGNQYFIRR